MEGLKTKAICPGGEAVDASPEPPAFAAGTLQGASREHLREEEPRVFGRGVHSPLLF